MGTSTDALLFYGIELGEGDSGVADIIELDEYPEDMFSFLEQKLKDAGLSHLEVGYHCHHECPMYFISAKKFSASRGYPSVIELEKLAPQLSWDNDIFRACEALGLEHTEPQWVLASYWG